MNAERKLVKRVDAVRHDLTRHYEAEFQDRQHISRQLCVTKARMSNVLSPSPAYWYSTATAGLRSLTCLHVFISVPYVQIVWLQDTVAVRCMFLPRFYAAGK